MEGKTQENFQDFTDKWQDVNPEKQWTWNKFDESSKPLTGWLVKIRTEKFVNGDNLVAYFVNTGNEDKPFEEHIRFILPTDLKKQLTFLAERIKATGHTPTDILIQIIYKGKVKTAKGYNVKTFNVRAKKQPMPEAIKANIPDIPGNVEHHTDDDITPEDIGF